MERLALAVFKFLSRWRPIQRFMLRTINTRYLAGVVGVVENDRGEVLLFHHTYRNKFAWGLPGGWLKRGEQPGAALRREIKEESGYDVKIVGPLHVFSEKPLPALEMVYHGRLTGGTFSPSNEVDEEIWTHGENLPDDIKPLQRQVIEGFLKTKSD